MKRFILYTAALLIAGAAFTQDRALLWDREGLCKLLYFYRSQEYSKIIGRSDMTLTYHFAYMPDTTKDERFQDRMLLQIGDKFTKFYSQHVYLHDSIATEWAKDRNAFHTIDPKFIYGIETRPQYYEIFCNRTARQLKVFNREPVSHGRGYVYTEEFPEFKWDTSSEDTCEILGYLCRKATCTFRGRNYCAWYCPELPIETGPWKFGGLPGIILKCEDSQKQYLFECIGIQKSNGKIIEFIRGYSVVNREKWNDMNRQFHADPLHTVVDPETTIYVKTDRGGMKKLTQWQVAYNPIERE